jgi:hypothetical protein
LKGAKKMKVICANCKKPFESSDYADLCDAIMGHKPSCSYECNKALGQVCETLESKDLSIKKDN